MLNRVKSQSRRVAGLIVAGWVVASGGAALAQDEIVTAEFTSDSGWRFLPAVEDGQVVGFLAEHLHEPAGPNAFQVVWFERVGDEFVMSLGWTDASVLEAGLEVAVTQRANPTLFGSSSLRTEMSDSLDDGCGGIVGHIQTPPGTEIQSGLSIHDPLQAVIDSIPPEFLDTFIELGAAGAIELTGQGHQILIENSIPTTAMSVFLLKFAEYFEIVIASTTTTTDIPIEPDYAYGLGYSPRSEVCTYITVPRGCTFIREESSLTCNSCIYSCTSEIFEWCADPLPGGGWGPSTLRSRTMQSKEKPCPAPVGNAPCPATPSC